MAVSWVGTGTPMSSASPWATVQEPPPGSARSCRPPSSRSGERLAERWPRKLAMPAARRYGHWVRLDQHKLKIARYVFDTMAPRWCPFGRFVSILRTYAAFLAGTSRMRWRKFLVANAAGGILWAGIYTLAAYLAGNALQRASGTIDLVIVAVAIVA